MPPFVAARPEEILLPVRPWFIVLTLLAGLLANTLPGVGRRADLEARFPGAGAPLLVHPGAAADRRRRRLVARTDDGRRRCDGVRPACAGVRGARVRRRLFSPARAALPALAAGGAGGRAAAALRAGSCCWCASSAARPLPRWTYVVGSLTGALLWPLVTGAAAMAAAPAALAVGALANRFIMRRLFTQRGRAARLLAAGAQEPRARGLSLPPAAADRRRADARRVRRAVRPLLLPAGHPARPLPDAGREQSRRDRADRAQPRRDHRPQRRRARAELLGLHAGDRAVAGGRISTRRSTSWPRSSTSSRATASASSACSRNRSASRACRCARA